MHALAQEAALAIAEAEQMPRFRASYEFLLPEILKLPRDEYLTINLDIPAVVTTVLGTRRNLAQLREASARQLADFDQTLFDRIETLALAMGHAHVLYKAASAPAVSLKLLSGRVLALRESLLADLRPFVLRGLIDGRPLKELPGPNGYKNQAFDLLALTTIARGAWANIQGNALIKSADLDEAETLIHQLLAGVGTRRQRPEVIAHSIAMRRAAYTLFMRAYSQLRRAAEYLRWDQGDAAEYVPLLTAGRKRRKRDVTQAASVSAEDVVASPEEQPLAAARNDQPVGVQGADPFADVEPTRVRR